MRLLVSVALAGFAAPAAAEGCFGAGTPLFHCTLKGGARAVDLCLQGDVGVYRYGPPGGAAELILAQRAADMFMWPWNGVGSSIYEEAGVYNGDVAYTVHYAISRIAVEALEVSGGIVVTRGDQTLAELACDPGSVSLREFYPVFEAKQASGQCWDPTGFSWRRC